MPKVAKAKTSSTDSTANLGFEAKLWLNADTLRDTVDTAEPSEGRRPAHEGRRPALMNLAIRGIEADIGKEHSDTFRSAKNMLTHAS